MTTRREVEEGLTRVQADIDRALKYVQVTLEGRDPKDIDHVLAAMLERVLDEIERANLAPGGTPLFGAVRDARDTLKDYKTLNKLR